MMSTTITQAANSSPDGTKYADKEKSIKVAISETSSKVETIRTVAQCMPDLSNPDCKTCLDEAQSRLTSCCIGSKGARILFPSCMIQYGEEQSTSEEPYSNKTVPGEMPHPTSPVPPVSAPEGMETVA